MATSYVDPTPAGARPADLPNIEKIKMLVRQVRGKVSPIYLDYKVDPVPRWGWGYGIHTFSCAFARMTPHSVAQNRDHP